MKIKPAVAETFQTVVTAVTAVDKMEESQDATAILALEGGTLVLGKHSDEPTHVVETEDGVVIVGGKKAVMVDTLGGVTVKPLPKEYIEECACGCGSCGSGGGTRTVSAREAYGEDPTIEDVQEWVDVAVMPSLDASEGDVIETIRAYDAAIENGDLDGAFEHATALTTAAGISEDDAQEVVEKFNIFRAKAKGTRVGPRHPSRVNIKGVVNRVFKRTAAKVRNALPGSRVRNRFAQQGARNHAGAWGLGENANGQEWTSPYAEVTEADYAAVESQVLDWLGEHVTPNLKETDARDFSQQFDAAIAEGRHADALDLAEQFATKAGLDEDAIEEFRMMSAQQYAKMNRSRNRPQNAMRKAINRERRMSYRSHKSLIQRTARVYRKKTANFRHRGESQDSVTTRVIAGPEEGIEALAGFLTDLTGVDADVYETDDGVELHLPDDVADDAASLMDEASDLPDDADDDALNEFFLRNAGKTKRVTAAFSGRRPFRRNPREAEDDLIEDVEKVAAKEDGNGWKLVYGGKTIRLTKELFSKAQKLTQGWVEFGRKDVDGEGDYALSHGRGEWHLRLRGEQAYAVVTGLPDAPSESVEEARRKSKLMHAKPGDVHRALGKAFVPGANKGGKIASAGGKPHFKNSTGPGTSGNLKIKPDDTTPEVGEAADDAPDCPKDGTTMEWSDDNNEWECPECGYTMDDEDVADGGDDEQDEDDDGTPAEEIVEVGDAKVKIVRRAHRNGETLYTVHKGNGGIAGLLTKKSNESAPWKAFKYDGDGKRPHTALGAHYGKTGRADALLTVVKTSEAIESPNSSGQGHDPDHKSNPFHATIVKHGFTYSHSTPVTHGDKKVIHHTYKKGNRNVSVHYDPKSSAHKWSSSKGGSGVHTTGFIHGKLDAHLKRLKEDDTSDDDVASLTDTAA